MTVFDATMPDTPEATPLPPEESVSPALSSLDLLRARVSDKATQELDDPQIAVETPDGGFRIVCSTDISHENLQRWQRAALPPAQRRSASVSPLDLNQLVFATRVLVGSWKEIQVRGTDGETWETIRDTQGTVLGPKDKVLLDALGVLSSDLVIKKLFGRDSDVIRTSREVLSAAGWGDEVDNADDPQ